MPSAAIPTVSPSFKPFAGLLAALRCLARKPADARFRPNNGRSGRQKATRLQRDELMAMSTHELNDLGIGRSEIPALLGKPGAWRASRY